jgi:hypothetical protein
MSKRRLSDGSASQTSSKRRDSSPWPAELTVLMSRYQTECTLHDAASQPRAAQSNRVLGLQQMLGSRPAQICALINGVTERARLLRSLEASAPTRAGLSARLELVNEGVSAVQAFQRETAVEEGRIRSLMGDVADSALQDHLEGLAVKLHDIEEAILSACLDVVINGWPA